jgi:hypothetical protein
MPHYHFVTRSKDAPLAEIFEYPNDDAAIEAARLALGTALREAARERCLLNDEIEVCKEDGTIVAVVVCDGSARH